MQTPRRNLEVLLDNIDRLRAEEALHDWQPIAVGSGSLGKETQNKLDHWIEVAGGKPARRRSAPSDIAQFAGATGIKVKVSA